MTTSSPDRAQGSPAARHLAWRLDSGQLVSADQLLAKLCAIPTNDKAIAIADRPVRRQASTRQ